MQSLASMMPTAVDNATQQHYVDVEPQATKLMCFHCFDTLIHNLSLTQPHQVHQAMFPSVSNRTQQHQPLFWKDLPRHNVQCPLFVTWEKRKGPSFPSYNPSWFFASANKAQHRYVQQQQQPQQQDGHYELRGCIGSLSPLPLSTALTKYALISALQDQRFTSIHASELALLRVAVSLLVQYEPCQNAYDWQVGVHGIIIKFSIPQHPRYYSATYLPEVASEQGWDPPTTVHSLIRKAGYQGPISPNLLQSIQCTRYQSSKIKMTFGEYLTLLQEQHDPRTLPTAASPQRNPPAAAVYAQSGGSSSNSNNTATAPMQYALKPPAVPSSDRNEGSCTLL